MERIKVIKLSYDIEDKADYVYLSEFFRFIGVFVWEDIINRDSSFVSHVEKNTEYDYHLYVKDWKHENSPMIRRESNEQKEILSDIVSEIWKTRNVDYLIKNGKADSLLDIYVDLKIAYHNANLQYYPKKISTPIRQARNAFIEAYNRICEIKEYQNTYYTYYSSIWCRVRANLACDYAEKIPYFFIEDLSRECKEFCENYSEFDNAKILLGLCYEPFKGNALDALLAFSKSLSEIKENCYSSSVYYWMGKWFESYNKKADAKKAYELANKKRIKYRTTFKLAILTKEEKKYEEALEIFDRILQELKLKMQFQYIDPLELEYVFKTYVQKCSIYYEQQNYNKIIENGETAIRIKESIDSNKYLNIFYGDEDAIRYKKYIKNRLRLQNVYWFLIGAYRRNGQEEKAISYEQKLEELEK